MNIEQQVLDFIIKNKNINGIEQELDINKYQLLEALKKLKQIGYYTYPEITQCGEVVYQLNKSVNPKLISLLPDKNDRINMLAISDLHFGSGYEREDLLNKVYEYAIKNDIYVILNLGDLIHGYESDLSTEKQLELLIQKYPYDENIHNIILLGNHDFHSLHYDGLDISKYLFEARDDFFNAGYGVGYVNVYNQLIGLFHNLSVEKSFINTNFNTIFNLYGHSHTFATNVDNVIKIKVPTLSDLLKNDSSIPSFLHLTLELDKSVIKKLIVKNIIVVDKHIEVSEEKYNIPFIKKKK